MLLRVRRRSARSGVLAALLIAVAMMGRAQEPLPREIAGTWRITRVLPARSVAACWTEQQAGPLVGSTLTYSSSALRWRDGVVPLTGITTRTVGTADLAEEELRGDRSLTLADLGFRGQHVLEVNLQHEDADVTGATTEVPGDSVLIAGGAGDRGRLVLSACGVYLEARRVSSRSAERPVVGMTGATAERGGS